MSSGQDPRPNANASRLPVAIAFRIFFGCCAAAMRGGLTLCSWLIDEPGSFPRWVLEATRSRRFRRTVHGCSTSTPCASLAPIRRRRRRWTSRSRSHGKPPGGWDPELREQAALPRRSELPYRRGMGLCRVDMGRDSVAIAFLVDPSHRSIHSHAAVSASTCSSRCARGLLTCCSPYEGLRTEM